MAVDGDWHIKVNKSKRPDFYARPPKGSLWEDEPCGCPIQPCGFVAPDDDCPWHGKKPQVRIGAGHLASKCPGGNHE